MSDTQEGLVAWLHSQEEWLQEAAHRLANTGEPLDDGSISTILTLLKTPEGRSKSNHRVFPQLAHAAPTSMRVRLVSIGPVNGIDRLAPRTPLAFGDTQLCVIYGHNGSGKSGYTRILARATGKPGAAELRPNAYSPTPAAQGCTITYSIDGAQKAVNWDPATGPIEDLRCIDIFDTDTADHYLTEETTASYTPPAVSLLERLAKTCQLITTRLNDEQATLNSTLPKVPSQFENTEICRAYKALQADTPPHVIAKLTTWTPVDEAKLESLDSTLAAVAPAIQAQRLRDAGGFTEKLLQALKAIEASLTPDELAALRQARACAEKATVIAEEASRLASNDACLAGVGTDTWKALWRAAREYATVAYPGFSFPRDEAGSRCVLCHQHLDAEATTRLVAFDTFTQGQVATEAEHARQEYENLLARLPTLPTSEDIAQMSHAANLPPDWPMQPKAFLEAAAQALKGLRDHEASAVEISPVLPAAIESGLVTHAASLAEQASHLASVSDASTRATKENERAELAARKWCSEHASEIQDEIARCRKLAAIADWKRAASSTPISRKAGQLAEELINAAYVHRFNAELQALGAHRIRVELAPTRVAKGTQFLRLRLKEAAGTTDGPDLVLSEGERRVVSLAAFLADVTAGPSDSPFVFDDPITSLDHDYEERVVARLCSLSKTRQVIVLTHRMNFLTALTEPAFKSVKPIHISGRGARAGDPDWLPMELQEPAKALDEITTHHLSLAKQALEAGSESAYRIHAKAICSDFRIIVERVIEKRLLFGVVERHKRKLTTHNVIENLAIITKDDCDLLASFMTKYSYFEHSQPDEAPVRLPDPDEIAGDCATLAKWMTTYANRAKGKA